MKRVNNEIFKKEFKKINNLLIIGIVFVILTSFCALLLLYENNRVPTDTKNLNEIIEGKLSIEELQKEATFLNDVIDKQKNAEGVNSYLVITKLYTAIATYKNTDKALYIVEDKDKYLYLVCLTKDEYTRISKIDLAKNPETIYGVTKKTESNVKSYAVNWYNSNVDAEDKIKLSEFNSYFGGVYLDNTTPLASTHNYTTAEEKANIKINKIYGRVESYSAGSKKLYAAANDDFYYIIALSDSEYENLSKKDLKKNPETIYGTTKKTNSSITNAAIKWYNKEFNKNITTSEYNNYFAQIYLDTTKDSIMMGVLAGIIFISSICTFTYLLLYFVRKLQTEKVLKNISDEELAKIEKDVDGKETFHYERAHLVLSKKYLISFVGKLLIVEYKDIVWIYEHRLKQHGITTTKSLMAMLKDGKTKALLQVDGITKKSTSIINEVAETIASKNEKILIGYTKENREKSKEIVKESK